MSLSSFLKLVEIQTKVASIIPFSLGALYALYHFHRFNFKNFIFMLISLLAFDMATTAINNFMDYKKANKTEGYGYEKHNAIVRDNLKESAVLCTIFMLLIIATIFGFMLFLNTNIVILIIGALAFLVGILYSFGPLPISRMPLGEIFSGLCMGFVIVFISTYIHVDDENIVSFMYEEGILSMKINVLQLLYIFLISLPAVSGISNIMLANNTCDIEEDIENKRYTLPVYIGKKNALKLFKALYYISYVDIIILLILKIEPILGFITILTIIPVRKNIMLFYKNQTKKDTFVLAVKNFVLINLTYIASILIMTVVNYL